MISLGQKMSKRTFTPWRNICFCFQLGAKNVKEKNKQFSAELFVCCLKNGHKIIYIVYKIICNILDSKSQVQIKFELLQP